MSVNELQALTQKLPMPSISATSSRSWRCFEDVEVFDHVPYRFDGKPLFAKYLHEAVAGLVSGVGKRGQSRGQSTNPD